MRTIELNRRYLFILIGLCLFSLVAIFGEIRRSRPEGIEVVSENRSTSFSVLNPVEADMRPGIIEETSASDLVPVYLVGAVNKPGIFLVAKGSYLFELIEQAGGLQTDAASNEINLAMAIQGNCRIWSPTQAEVARDPAKSDVMKTDRAPESKLIDINTATQEELDLLPGIGPATAKAIIDYRERNGAFEEKNDLMKIPGIKQSRMDAIVDLITIS